jgi:hypothetical protein
MVGRSHPPRFQVGAPHLRPKIQHSAGEVAGNDQHPLHNPPVVLFSLYDATMSRDQIADLVVADVIGFLDNLFADRVLLWQSPTDVSLRREHQPPGIWTRERSAAWVGDPDVPQEESHAHH